MEWILAALFMALVLGLSWLQNHSLKPTNAPALFKPKILLTENELEFLLRLERAVPEFRFHAQVAMGALISPTLSPYKQGREYYRLRGQFSQKIVDFVAQHRGDGRIIAVIELDDRTHNPEKDARRDNLLHQAGYRVVRWHSKSKPDLETIRRELFDSSIT